MDHRRAAAALLALAAYIACSAAAPTASNHTALELHEGPIEGCYYNFQHYGEGDRIMTNEPCLNCTCHNRMLMCYLRVCPFTKAIGQDCTVEKRADQCCPIVTCPDVPVDLLTSTSTSSPAEYGTTGIGKLDKYGCSINGKYFPEGSKVPPTPNKPCEHCYCIRNMTTCVMQECTLHVDGCTPIYHKDVCCPVRYSCDHSEDEIPLLDDMTTTARPTPGFLLTTTTMVPVTQMSQDCVHDDQVFPDGALIKTEKACEHCYCMKGDIVCVVQECGTPMENEGKNCTSLPPRHGQCCPDTYICEGDELHGDDSTTKVLDITTAPPRRVGVEGSGYRNEPDEPYTEMGTLMTEIEGSGEEYATIPSIDTAEILIPEKESSETIDDMLIPTTEKTMHLSTEPDKGQNTIPDSTSDKETSDGLIQSGIDHAEDVDENNLSTASDTMITESHIQSTGDITSRKDEFVTTESAFRKEDSDENIADKVSTEKQYEKATTPFADLVDKTIYEDEYIPHTSPETTKNIVKDQKTTSPPREYTYSVDDLTNQKELTTEIIEQTAPTEKNKFTDGSITTSDTETYIGLTTIRDEKIDIEETTSTNPIINEVDETIPLPSSPSRIPGEGDCLLNGITYTNNTIVPSTNNCHINCKCVSSIIKCDPIICSPPPEYMENMNDCQPIYDAPDSCCPTYVCSAKETIPPQSHSQMSGTESPKTIEGSECKGNECPKIEDELPLTEKPSDCISGDCLPEISKTQEQCNSEHCKEQVETSPEKPQDCSGEECKVPPIAPCEGEDCKTKPNKEVFPEKELEPGLQDVSSTICNEKDGCEEQKIVEADKCIGQDCRRTEIAELGGKQPSECSGSDCKTHEEPTLPSVIEQSTQIASVDKATTLSDDLLNLKTTESTETYETTSKDKVTVLSVEEITKQPHIYTDSSESLPTESMEIVTEQPTPIENDSSKTVIPIIQVVTEKSDEDVSKTETPEYESPKVSEATISDEYEPIHTETPIKEQEKDIYEHTTGKDHTDDIEPEVFTDKVDQVPTQKPQDIDTYITESEYTIKLTESPVIEVTDKQVIEPESPDGSFTEKEGIITKSPEVIDSDDTEKELIQTEIPVPTIDETENDVIPSISTETIKSDQIETQTEVPKSEKTEMESFETEVTEASIFEKEKEQTEIPETVTSKTDIIMTETPPAVETEKEIFKTRPPETPVTEKQSTETDTSKVESDEDKVQTEEPEKSIDRTKEKDETISPDAIVTEKIDIQTSIPEQDEIKVETTTLVDKPIDVTSVIQDIDEVKEDHVVPLVTEEPVTEILASQTEKVNIFDEEKHKYDVSHESKPVTSEEISTEKISEISHEPLGTFEPQETETEKVATDTFVEPQTPDSDLTEDHTLTIITHEPEPDRITTLSEEGIKVPIKEPQEIVTEKHDDIYDTATLATQDLITKSEDSSDEHSKEDITTPQVFDTDKQSITTVDTLFENEITVTVKESLQTERPDTYETKYIDQPTTESQVILTKAPEIIATQFDDIPVGQDTSKQTESFVHETESILSSTQGIIINQVTYTESPESYLTQDLDIKDVIIQKDETTILPEVITTTKDEIAEKEKDIDKEYLPTTVEIEKPVEKNTNEPIDILTVTTESIKSTIITDSNIKETEEKEITVTETTEQQTFADDLNTSEESNKDKKPDFETHHMATTPQDTGKILETSTSTQDILTEDSTKLPIYVDELPQELTTVSGHLVTESKKPYKDVTTQELLTTVSEISITSTQSPHKDEHVIEQKPTIPQEGSTITSDTDKEIYLETSTHFLDKDNIQPGVYQTETPKQVTEAEIVNEITTLRQVSSQSENEIEVIDYPGSTGAPDINKDTVDLTHTVQEQEKETPFVTESLTTKHSDFSQDKLEIGTTEEYSAGVTEHTSIGTEMHEIEKITLPTPEKQKPDKTTFEISTGVPESTTKFDEQVTEHSEFDIKEKDIIPDSTSQTFLDIEKQTTISGDKIVDEEQEIDHDVIVTTVSNIQSEDDTKITEKPMSLVTDIEEEKSPQMTVTEKQEILSHSLPTTLSEQNISEEKTQTTESQKQYTDHSAHEHEGETETSTKINVEDLPYIIPPYENRTTLASTDDDLSKDHHLQTTDTSDYLPDADKEITTISTVEADLIEKVTQVTPTIQLSHTGKEETSTTLPISETETPDELPQQYPTSISILEDKSTTVLFHEGYTVPEKITTSSPKTLEVKEEDKIMTEQQEPITEYPEIHTPNIHTILPEQETTEIKTEVFDGATESLEKFISTATERDIGVHSSEASVITEESTTTATDIKDADTTKAEQKPTEIGKTPEIKPTTYGYVDIITEEQTVTESIPLIKPTEAHHEIVTLKEESSTKLLDQDTSEAEQTEAENKPTEPSQIEEHHAITPDTEAENIDAQKPAHEIDTQDAITTMLESQTENIGIDKVPSIVETSGELETAITTEKGIEYHSETLFPASITDKGVESTPPTQSVVQTEHITETAKIEEHTITEPSQTELVDATAGPESTEVHEEDTKQTSESEYKFSETTPFLVELEEHTHKVIDESSRSPLEEAATTVPYETQQTERGDQSLDVSDKHDHEYHTFEPTRATDQLYEDKEKSSSPSQEQIDEDIHATTAVLKDVTESSTTIETEKITSPKIDTSSVSDSQEVEKSQTMAIKDTTLLPSTSPQLTSEKELYTTASSDVQKATQSEQEIAFTTEKTTFSSTEDNLKPEISHGTTLSEEVYEQQTSKATTIKTKEETYLPPTINKSKPEEKPIVTTISPAHESSKPGFNDEIIDDFPPSGTGGYGQEPDYVEEDQAFGPGTCRYGGKVYVSAQQIPRDDPCDFCFCFRSDIICLQQSCPPPIHGCHEEPIQGFCCPRYECPVSMATTLNVTTTTTTTTTTLPPHFLPHAYKGAAQRRGCQIKGHTYKVGEVVRASSGPCLHCMCGGDGQMKCDPKACTPEPMLRQMIAAAVSAKRRR